MFKAVFGLIILPLSIILMAFIFGWTKGGRR